MMKIEIYRGSSEGIKIIDDIREIPILYDATKTLIHNTILISDNSYSARDVLDKILGKLILYLLALKSRIQSKYTGRL